MVCFSNSKFTLGLCLITNQIQWKWREQETNQQEELTQPIGNAPDDSICGPIRPQFTLWCYVISWRVSRNRVSGVYFCLQLGLIECSPVLVGTIRLSQHCWECASELAARPGCLTKYSQNVYEQWTQAHLGLIRWALRFRWQDGFSWYYCAKCSGLILNICQL